MIENIKHIGIFMIVAQTFMHFAAGKQYEKYMKIIAGIIVLLMFVRPFSISGEDFAKLWQQEMIRMTDQIESRNDIWQKNISESKYETEDTVVRRIEEEIRRKLNEETVLGEYKVTSVAIKWKKDADQMPVVDYIRIILRQAADDGETLRAGDKIDPVLIKRVQVDIQAETEKQETEEEWQDSGLNPEDERYSTGQGKAGQTESIKQMREYRSLFAEILGIAEEKVEVVADAGW